MQNSSVKELTKMIVLSAFFMHPQEFGFDIKGHPHNEAFYLIRHYLVNAYNIAREYWGSDNSDWMASYRHEMNFAIEARDMLIESHPVFSHIEELRDNPNIFSEENCFKESEGMDAYRTQWMSSKKSTS